MRKRTIIVHGSRAVLDSLMGAITGVNIKVKDGDNFTPAMLEELRRQYSQIRSIDPGGEAYGKLVSFLGQMSQPQLRQLAAANIPFLSRLARNRVVAKDASYYTCPVCEANFPASALVTGTMPTHKYLGKPCPGIGEFPTKDAGGPPRNSPDGPIQGNKIKWEYRIKSTSGSAGGDYMYTVYDPKSGYVFEESYAPDRAGAVKAAEASIKVAERAKIYDHCGDLGTHVNRDPSKPVRDDNSLIGKQIRFKVPGPSGLMTKVGTIKEGVRPGELEVKAQDGGYYKLSQIGQYEIVG